MLVVLVVTYALGRWVVPASSERSAAADLALPIILLQALIISAPVIPIAAKPPETYACNQSNRQAPTKLSNPSNRHSRYNRPTDTTSIIRTIIIIRTTVIIRTIGTIGTIGFLFDIVVCASIIELSAERSAASGGQRRPAAASSGRAVGGQQRPSGNQQAE